jgi:Kdo2-lipid IVA lauroyltransferase/acyltransferase
MARRRRSRVGDAATYAAVRILLAALSPLPWSAQGRVAAWAGRTAVTRSRRLRARVLANLGHVLPETNEAEREAILRATGDCFGRTALELFAAPAFRAARPWTAPTGPGLAAAEAAIRDRTGAIFVSGHFGGWEAIRAWLTENGAPCATVYRALPNPWLERFYLERIVLNGRPVVPKGRLAVRVLVRHLAEGGFVALLVDQHERRAPALDFLGRPAPTTLAPAELALRFRVPLIPAFAPRSDDGARIDIVFGAPAPPSTPEAMMQAVNDALAEQVRARPGQYYWLHRRWSKSLPGLAEPARTKS